MMGRWKSYFRALGPGLVTGASDDDPAGVSTYSIAGASTGYARPCVDQGIAGGDGRSSGNYHLAVYVLLAGIALPTSSFSHEQLPCTDPGLW